MNGKTLQWQDECILGMVTFSLKNKLNLYKKSLKKKEKNA